MHEIHERLVFGKRVQEVLSCPSFFLGPLFPLSRAVAINSCTAVLITAAEGDAPAIAAITLGNKFSVSACLVLAESFVVTQREAATRKLIFSLFYAANELSSCIS